MRKGELSATRSVLYRAVRVMTGKDVKHHVKPIIDTFLTAIKQELRSGRKIRLQGFGVFEMKFYRPRMGNRVNGGGRVPIPARWKPRFKPSRVF